MKRTHVVAFVVVIAATLVLSVGTGSFTALSADRNVDIGTTSDDSAYLAISYDETTDELQLTNNFETPLTVTGIETSASVAADGVQDELAVSKSKAVALSCTDDSQSVTGSVTVTAEGDDVSVEVTQDVTVDCETTTATPS